VLKTPGEDGRFRFRVEGALSRPRLKGKELRSYRLHKQSGQTIVTLRGKDVLLGRYGSVSSKAEYKRVTSE
jgi:hypothetical protein